MALSAVAIAQAKPKAKPVKLFDGEGLYLLIKPSGQKGWRFKYRFSGKEKLLSFGNYPYVSLKDAREKRTSAKELLAKGIDPSVERQREKSSAANDADNSFNAVAQEWFEKFSKNWEPSHSSKIIRRLERDVFPVLGKKPIRQITPLELLKCIQRIEKRGVLETAHRAMQNVGAVFRYAIATGRAERDITVDLRGSLPPTKQTHYPTITDPDEIGELLETIEASEMALVTKCALRLAPLVFVRPGELRKAEWSEINWEKAEWRIPPERMKMRRLHVVPLSKQAIAILKELKEWTSSGRFLFPGAIHNKKPMSDGTINAALRRMGYKEDDRFTGHGFRSMASTILNENGWNRDAVERQLAHGETDKVRGAYNYAEMLPERRKMMQWWADYLEKLLRKN
jgi:integrase